MHDSTVEINSKEEKYITNGQNVIYHRNILIHLTPH